jgi:hypothetical protein
MTYEKGLIMRSVMLNKTGDPNGIMQLYRFFTGIETVARQ